MKVPSIIQKKCLCFLSFLSSLTDLASRFEPPSPLTRWDSPLFRICPVEADSEESPLSGLTQGFNKNSTVDVPKYKEPPLQAIWESLTVVKTQAKHIAINPPVVYFDLAYR